MPRGGARNRSGPSRDPSSGRSDARGYSLTALPASGFDGPVPVWPLDAPSERELEVWAWAWRTPQACAWSQPSEEWRQRTVAMWCRVAVQCESRDVPAALLGQLHRFADQVGLTTAGLAEMGWKVAEDEVAAKSRQSVPAAPPRARRLRQVGGDVG